MYSVPFSLACNQICRGLIYQRNNRQQKPPPLTQLAHPVIQKKKPRPSYECKPLRAHTHALTDSGNTNRIPVNHILLFNCNKLFSCLCLFPYPPPDPKAIQEITWLRN